MKTKVAVIGAGVMGAGIAQRAATFGFCVTLVDKKDEYLKAAEKRIVESLGKMFEKGIISDDMEGGTLTLIEMTTDINAISSSDLVIEAVNENLELKQKIFMELDQICSSKVILATNTSSIPIASLASVTKSPQRVVGLHFMNPVPLIPLVEMIRTDQTSDATFQACRAFLEEIGCEPVHSKDCPGFIINRILIPMINEAVKVLESDVASAKDIDRAMVLGTKQPMGPLALADLIGLDTVVNILETLYAGFKDERYRPCPLLLDYVRQNKLGRKTGHGFFDYWKCPEQASPQMLVSRRLMG
jgi:3-hydroxybutyryl-CoA dehydrogenase